MINVIHIHNITIEFKIKRIEHTERSHNSFGGSTAPSQTTVTVIVPPEITDNEEDEIIDGISKDMEYGRTDELFFDFEYDKKLERRCNERKEI